MHEISLVTISLKFHLAISTEELTSLQALCSGRKFQLREISFVSSLKLQRMAEKVKFHFTTREATLPPPSEEPARPTHVVQGRSITKRFRA